MTDADDPIDLTALEELIAGEDYAAAAAAYAAAQLGPDETRALLGVVRVSAAAQLVAALPDDEMSRRLLSWLPPDQSASILEAMEPSTAARLLARMQSDERADLLIAVDDEARAAIGEELPASVRSDTARLVQYESGTAGGLMETELLAFPAGMTVREAIRDLRTHQVAYAAIGVQYVYVVAEERRLLGVTPLRDLMLAPEDATLGSLIKRSPLTVLDTATTRELAYAFDEHSFVALPVVDERGVLLGVVNRADATQREYEEAEDDFRVSQGIVGGEELRSMPVVQRLRRRGAWLGVNLVLCLGGAAVIAWHQQTLAKAIVVMAVLPVISATSGNAAMQAAAVSIRELTLGVIDPAGWRRVLIREMELAALVSLPLGAAVAALAGLWGATWMIGVAVGIAMALNVLFAIGIGALCPLMLRRVHIDPALASGPLSTTIADVTGFGLTLALVGSLAV